MEFQEIPWAARTKYAPNAMYPVLKCMMMMRLPETGFRHAKVSQSLFTKLGT